MATAQKSNSERSSRADSESICPGCPNRFGKAKPAPCVLRRLLRTHVRPGYHARNQIGAPATQGLSPVLVSSAASATFGYVGGRHANANTVGYTRTKETRTQTQREISCVVSLGVLPARVRYSIPTFTFFVARSSSG